MNAAYAADERRWSSLMASAQAGHEADYRTLLNEVSLVVTKYLVSRIGPHYFLDDCVQETLIAIHQARHTYDPARKFRPWLFAIVRHKFVDALRKQRTTRNLEDGLRTLQTPHTNSSQMENNVIAGRLMACLSQPHRDAITLTKIVGLSTAEAAEQLSISKGALKVRVHRAIGKLRRLIEAEEL